MLHRAGRLRDPISARTRNYPEWQFPGACHRALAGTEPRARVPAGPRPPHRAGTGARRAVHGLRPSPSPARWVPEALCPARTPCCVVLLEGTVAHRGPAKPGSTGRSSGASSQGRSGGRGSPAPWDRHRATGAGSTCSSGSSTGSPHLPASCCRQPGERALRRGQKPRARQPCKCRRVGLPCRPAAPRMSACEGPCVPAGAGPIWQHHARVATRSRAGTSRSKPANLSQIGSIPGCQSPLPAPARRPLRRLIAPAAGKFQG